MNMAKIVEDERLLKLLKPYERAPKVDIAKFVEEFKRLINDEELEPNLDKCIFLECLNKVALEIPVKRGLSGICSFHWSTIADSDVEWEAEKTKRKVRRYRHSSVFSFPLKLRDTEKAMGEEHVYAPIDFDYTNRQCSCSAKMLLVTYKNNFGNIIKLYDCPYCGHMEEQKA